MRFAIVFLCLLPGIVQAQEAAAGSRVRLQVAGADQPLLGTLAGRDGTDLLVIREPGDTARIASTSVTSLEVSRGQRSNVLQGGKVGALVGSLAGAVLGVVAMSDDGGFLDLGPEMIPIGMAGGALLGGTAGLLIGALFHSERWERTAPPAIVIRPFSHGLGLAANLRF